MYLSAKLEVLNNATLTAQSHLSFVNVRLPWAERNTEFFFIKTLQKDDHGYGDCISTR